MKNFDSQPIMGIIRGADTEQVKAVVEAAVQGGLRTLEITLNRAEAFDQIAAIKARYADKLELGAGTVLDAEAAARAIAAGAEFIVTPALIPEVIEFCRSRSVPVFPGAMSPTEILAAHRQGATMVKLFPASALGPAYLRSLRGPFPEIPIMPTGGVTLTSVPEYFKAGASAIGVGGELFKKDWMRSGDWAAIEKTARSYVDAVKGAR